jgi:NAD(P)-dependent dehydrogenase (short-subunit alcohol dehydrogenase family)
VSEAAPVVVVTGAASGLGRASAMRLIDDGYDVVGFDRAGAPDHGPDCICGDLRSADDRNRVVEETNARPGPLVGMVNAAGVSPYVGPLVEIPSSRWELTYDVNVTGLFELTRDCLPLFNNGGSIVNVASIGPRRAEHPVGAYSSSKSAVIQLTRQLAHELGERQIRVNSISPGVHETPMADAYFDDPDQVASLEASIPLGRIGRPQDVAACAAWLLSDESSYITGAEIVIDGGLSL